MNFRRNLVSAIAGGILLTAAMLVSAQSQPYPNALEQAIADGRSLEHMDSMPSPAPPLAPRYSVPAISRMQQPQGFNSVQVNISPDNMNIIDDAANEPSIAVNPINGQQMVIGWRQFDSINNGFREAGVAFSADAGASWTYPGDIDAGVFRSDPVLAADSNGLFYYACLQVTGGNFSEQFFISDDGGATWSNPVEAFGGDKLWFALDDTGGTGNGHVYSVWNTAGNPFFPATFNRSINSAQSFQTPIEIPERPILGTAAVGPDGELYVVGRGSGTQLWLLRSDNAREAIQSPVFNQVTPIDVGGIVRIGAEINPVGLVGQVWVAVDHSNTATRGNVYVLASLDPPGDDPLDVMFIRSEDGGASFSDPVRVNDDSLGTNAWQWFGTISVAPNGRIDVIWYDTRNDTNNSTSELFYTYSVDAGQNFLPSVAASPAFDQSLGYPTQNKLGDYIDMKSDENGAHIAYAATFNGEQDVYYLFALPQLSEDFFRDGFENLPAD